jgi:hypothetical protein
VDSQKETDMNLYLVRAECDEGHNYDVHVIARTVLEAVELWEEGLEDQGNDGGNFVEEAGFGTVKVHLVLGHLALDGSPEAKYHPNALDWQDSEEVKV